MIIIAYYTRNTPYEDIVENLRESIETLGLKSDIVGIEDQGDWWANTHYKATFVKEMLEKHDDSILYVDADAVILRQPELLSQLTDCDIAIRYQDFDYRKNECLSGTVFFNNTEKTMELVEQWLYQNTQHGGKKGGGYEGYEQVNLDRAIQSIDNLNLYILPPEYTFIHDTMRKMYPDADPIIEHYQASRKHRK
jgi:hypothetical protein